MNMKTSTFFVDYNKKTLTLNYRGKTFNWDLSDGDVGDFWHSFRFNKKTLDINLYRESTYDYPSLTIYNVKSIGSKYVTDTSSFEKAYMYGLTGNPNNW